MDVKRLIEAVDRADSKAALVQAVADLAAARHPEAIPTLITVLGYNNPGAAVAAVDGLVSLGAAAVTALLTELDGYNYGARAWAIRALALIGDPRSLPLLLDTAMGDFALSVRRAATRGIGAINWSLVPDPEVETAQEQVLEALLQITLTDSEWVVRYAGVPGLETLARVNPAAHHDRILAHLQGLVVRDDTVAVQARAQWAVDRLQAACPAAPPEIPSPA
jgi:phycocyanobilin lyase beta subunit